jgi:hypothetical protein
MPNFHGPRLVPASGVSSARGASLLAMWHLLSLDAPTVAALWTYFLARSVGLTLPWASPLAMFIAVWMIYAADRLLDARALDGATDGQSTRDLEERHRFHHRHRGRFLSILVLAAFSLMGLLPRISPDALLLYSLLATLLAAWLIVIHTRYQHGDRARRLPKELAVGVFFPAAVFVPTVARAPQLQLRLLPCALLFAGVCTLNCLFVYAWEHPQDQARQLDNTFKHGRAHWTTLWAVNHIRQLALTLLALSALAALPASLVRPPALACALSAALLLFLHAQRRRVLPVDLRAAADAVLLTPLLLLPALTLLKR